MSRPLWFSPSNLSEKHKFKILACGLLALGTEQEPV